MANVSHARGAPADRVGNPGLRIRDGIFGTQTTVVWTSALLVAGLAACSGSVAGPAGVTGGDPDWDLQLDGGSGDNDRDGGGEQNASQGTIVGSLELAAPSEREFFLHATLPVPPGVYMDGDGLVPLNVLDADGQSVETQVSTVSRYADANRDGADVVQVVARVKRPQGVTPGERIRYQVQHKPQRPGRFQATSDSRSFLAAPSSLTLHTWDVFGNRYRADLLRDVRLRDEAARQLRRGSLVNEWETHSILRCDEDGAQGKLDRMMGAHTFLSQWSGEDIFTVGMRIHNGFSGLDPESPADDAYLRIYFEKLELRLPHGWTIVHAFDDPFIGEPRDEGGWTFFPIVRPMDDATLHVLRTQGQFVRRFAIAPKGQERRAHAMIGEQGLGFCRPGVSPDGADLWSWWNPLTARYLPQNCRLPLISDGLLPSIRQEKRNELFEIEDHLKNATHSGYPLVGPPLGYLRPWGAYYGGMTGGVEIDLTFGIDTTAAASRDGYRLAQLMSRMYIDRQHTALYNADGRPTRLEQWLLEGQAGLYFPGLFNQIPLLPQNDPFGFGNAPTFQTEAVIAQGKVPPYEAELLSYIPIDIQHWVRFTRPLKLLAWLGNDALAKSEIEAAGELYRLTHHEYPNSGNGNFAAAWGLFAAQKFVLEHPGQGFGFNRANGWGLDISASAYALGTRQLRERFYPWFARVVDVAAAGQSTCGGYLQAVPHHSNGALYRIRQNYESAITDNALRSLAQTVFRERDDEKAETIDEIMVVQAYGTITPAFWSFEGNAPHGTVAVGPHNPSLPPYCGNATDHWASTAVDTKYPWNTLAYAYELTGDQVFLNKASEVAGVGNLFNEMQSNQLADLHNRFAMLTLLQAINHAQ